MSNETKAGKKPRNVNLSVATTLVDSEGAEKLPDMMAYAFTSGGRLLAQDNVNSKGEATLRFAGAETPQAVRVVIGPEIEQEDALLAELNRRGARETHVRVNPQDTRLSASLIIPSDFWLCWLKGLCFVQGTVIKKVTSGGVQLDLPVCNATVEIYEVDPIILILPRLADDIIEKIRETIIDPPPPPPPPIVELPEVFPPLPEPPAPGPVFAQAARAAAPAVERMAVPDQPTVLASINSLRYLAKTTSTYQFRQILIDYAAFIKPILCLFPWWPFPVTKQLVATVKTDECGHFQAFFSQGCSPDKPDLYFKVKQRVLPFPFPPLTIYAPTPVACYTHWNYVCGTEVTLQTTHPLAMTCSPCPPVIAPNNWVLVMAIGNHSLSRIRGTSLDLQPTTNATNLGLTEGGAPFGGLIRPRVEFDNSLREDLGVKYYRVSYRKGTSGDFIHLTGEIHRHYTHEVGDDLILEVYPLGPKVVNGVPNLFEIPPALPPLGQWSLPDAVENTASAKFPSNAAPPDIPVADRHGKYQLKVDLFDETGQAVNIAAKGIKYRVPNVADLSGDIHTDDAAALGLVQGNSFIMTLHIDNRACSAAIDAPTLNGVAANACGVLDYDPDNPGSVTMDYTASHPAGFATYNFRLFRGATLLTPPSVFNQPVGAGSFSAVETVANLLAGCPVAGFSENVYVRAMATNGWSRLSGYDASAVRAYVLAPQEES